MALTRDFKQTVVERVEREPAFAQALLDEAATLFLNGEPETSRLILRDLINAAIGFEQLATLTAKPARACTVCCRPRATPTRTTSRIGNSNAVFPPHGRTSYGSGALQGSVRSRQRPAQAVRKSLRRSIGEVVHG